MENKISEAVVKMKDSGHRYTGLSTKSGKHKQKEWRTAEHKFVKTFTRKLVEKYTKYI